MAIQITAVRLSPGGATHEHITHLWWTDQASGDTGNSTRAQLVDWIENQSGRAYTCDAAGHRTEVAVVTPAHGEKYLRTRADGVWTNNLLAVFRR
ncbi:DUF3892 domain-containing protein [Kitasatospora purpeofusca]|uniref:DUF3892 domain-containing protein n=1 Tax=Kitasatospora purpeofusca TaxID=67352 RepID=UPI00225B90AF|nr:DUF3892 domain-containing protein [Kitasatospora purpeofusca]MCX4758596.1 DUF3892 domain-containing protein [Kitasatospora purpeofusca]WSR30963.1 DUF3892 domain-containing protein [Kitasatospora purpeofusca]